MMKKTLIEKTADKLVNAFMKGKIIAPIPSKFTKKLSDAQKLRKLCESKIEDPIIGFKAAGTGFPVMKKLKEKEPFYAAIFKKNFLTKLSKISRCKMFKIFLCTQFFHLKPGLVGRK